MWNWGLAVMSALLQLLFLIFSVKILGEGAERIGVPSVIGEILAGILFGIFFLDMEIEIITFLAELGSIFLLFSAGYREVSLKELESASITAFIPTLSQILFAFIFGFAVGRFFNFTNLESFFMGVAFCPTSIGIVLRTLIELNYLSSRPGIVMISSAVLDDILGVFFLSVLVIFARFNRVPLITEILLIAGKIVIFLFIMHFLGKYVFSGVFGFAQRMHVREAVFSSVIVLALFSAYLANSFELHSSIGAFIAGILISEIPLAKLPDIQSKISGLAHGFLIPLFFAFIGILIDLPTLQITEIFLFLIIFAALAGKLIGGFIGSKIIGFDFYESLIFGIGVMPRAGIELVILTTGRRLGIINQEIFSVMVLMVVISIFISPLLLKYVIQKKRQNQGILS